MGNVESVLEPRSLLDCFDEENCEIDPFRYYQYRKKRKKEASEQEFNQLLLLCRELANDEMKEAKKKKANGPRKKREEYLTVRQQYRDGNGELKDFGPYQTAWYQQYVENPRVHQRRFHTKFRRRFRMSFESYQKHLAEVKDSDLFCQWSENSKNAAGRRASPIELLVLGTLRYLGRSSFD